MIYTYFKISMEGEYKVITNPVVNVFVTCSSNSFGSERRFQKDLTVSALKGKLELITGASAGSMKLEIYSKDNKLICGIDNDDRLIGSYPLDDGCRLHVVDKSHQLGEFEDVSKVEKYEIPEEEYAKKTDTVRAFKERMKLGRFAEGYEEEQKKKEEEKQVKEREEDELAASMQAGQRCEVRVTGQPTKRGAVMYVGKVDFKPGSWVGVQYDEPLGKNDGSVQGKRYFECKPKYGGFVRPSQVTVGDFPEEDFMDFDDEM